MDLNLKRVTQKITGTLLLTQSLGAIAFSVIATVNTIIGAELSGQARLAGVPGAVMQLGSAAAALTLGFTMDRFGRRLGLGIGLGFGIIGGITCAMAVVAGNFLLFLIGLALFGVARAAQQMSRFAAAEIYRPELRGRVISIVVWGSVFGSVFGPQLAGPAGQLMIRWGLSELIGPYLAGLIAFGLASILVLIFLRPDPRDIGRQIAQEQNDGSENEQPTRPLRQILRQPAVIVAIVAMIFGQVVMVSLMGITSLHMFGHNHGLSEVATVFSSHTFGMFFFSLLTGWLTDKWGRGPVILSGGLVLILAAALAPISPDVLPLSAALFLLGLGWNFCFVGGSALLSDQLTPAERAQTQGVNDLMISLSTALASLVSGVVFAGAGYSALGIMAALAALVPLGLTGWWLMQPQKLATT